MDEFGRILADYRRADNFPGLPVVKYLHETIGFADGDRFADPAEGEGDCLETAPFRVQGIFARAETRDLRFAVDGGWDFQRIQAPARIPEVFPDKKAMRSATISAWADATWASCPSPLTMSPIA